MHRCWQGNWIYLRFSQSHHPITRTRPSFDSCYSKLQGGHVTLTTQRWRKRWERRERKDKEPIEPRPMRSWHFVCSRKLASCYFIYLYKHPVTWSATWNRTDWPSLSLLSLYNKDLHYCLIDYCGQGSIQFQMFCLHLRGSWSATST